MSNDTPIPLRDAVEAVLAIVEAVLAGAEFPLEAFANALSALDKLDPGPRREEVREAVDSAAELAAQRGYRLTPGETAELLSVSTERLTRMVREGQIPCYAFGDRPQQWRFDLAEVLRRRALGEGGAK